MGCIQSRKDINDEHPNVFRVFNIDNCGNCLWAGQLEVTESELVLYRRDQEPTRWPLICLRRYGFDTEMFSFESGRRCQTGEGIFAFKCRRAEQLFKVLQQYMKNTSENVLETLNSETPRLPNMIRASVPPSEYLEAMPVVPGVSMISTFPANIRISYGPLSPEVHSPGSPSSTTILEVMPLDPLPSSDTQVTNIYHLQKFPLREHNNNKKVCVNSNTHLYVNSDLANIRKKIQNGKCLQQPEVSKEAMAPLAKEEIDAPLSPTLSNTSEHYATLVVDNPVEDRPYMNVDPATVANDIQTQTIVHKHSSPRTPTSVDNISKINDLFTFMDNGELEQPQHNYANMDVSEVKGDPCIMIRQHFKHTRGSSLDTPISNEGSTKIKYVILDLPNNSKCSDTSTPGSPKDIAVDYTKIDFNKTGALKSVSQGMEVDTEGLRKTRHNSTAQPPDSNIT